MLEAPWKNVRSAFDALVSNERRGKGHPSAAQALAITLKQSKWRAMSGCNQLKDTLVCLYVAAEVRRVSRDLAPFGRVKRCEKCKVTPKFRVYTGYRIMKRMKCVVLMHLVPYNSNEFQGLSVTKIDSKKNSRTDIAFKKQSMCTILHI